MARAVEYAEWVSSNFMLQAILNKSWRQHLTKQQLYGHLPPISKTIQPRRTRHAEHCWRSRDSVFPPINVKLPHPFTHLSHSLNINPLDT